MDLLERTKELCRLHNIKPARSKGQNFLIRDDIYDDIVRAAEINKDDAVLEVGPGLGFLTAKLAEKSKKVIAVELDDKLAGLLKNTLASQNIKNVEVINEDVLDVLNHPAPLLGKEGKFKIVANLPYNISSVFMRKVLALENKPEMIVLMLQKEVAERIVAPAGEMSLLAVSVQYFCDGEIVQSVSKEDFYPAPEVDSAVIKLVVRKENLTTPRPSLKQGGEVSGNPRLKQGGVRGGFDYEKDFFRLVKFGFSARRKMLKNNLAGGYHLATSEAGEKIKKAGFSEKVRSQELTVEDWKKLLGEFIN